jgi:LysM repeat protein
MHRFRTGGIGLGVALATLFVASSPSAAQSLRGSRASLDIQNRVARDHDYTFIRTGAQLQRFVNAGYLVPVRGDRNYTLHAVSYPYARPEVELFVRRLGEQYRATCGEQLVVTSLTRPQNRQPRNASERSVHPTGMALDLRLSRDRNCRAWLEDVLTSLERAGVLEATRERYPAHYHIALFPRDYARYVERITEAKPQLLERVASAPVESVVDYTVRRGDSLWEIARAHGTTVDRIRAENRLRGNRIMAGQTLKVPAQQQQ